MPQGSVLGPLLFLIYINDLHSCLKYYEAHNFADDSNIIIWGSLQETAKRMNHDLRKLPIWLRTNKLSLNVEKRELAVLWRQNTKLNNSFQIKLDQKKLFPTNYLKYLGVLLDEHSSWPLQISYVQVKLNRATGILSKVWYQANIHILKTVYHSFLGTHLLYKAGYGV